MTGIGRLAEDSGGEPLELECPLKAGDECKDLGLIYAWRSEGEAMKILEEAFPDRIDRERDFWRAVVRANDTELLEMNGEPVGLTSLRRRREAAWIDLFAVRPGRQGSGLGRALLRASERISRDSGAEVGRLFVHADNTRAVSLYSSAGWRVAGYQPRGYVDGDRLTMEKDLQPGHRDPEL
jgi:ribosomal protein S18 acetylase RimI-like enzyme